MLEKTEGANQEWTIQKHRQHWVHRTQDEDNNKEKQQQQQQQRETTTTTTTQKTKKMSNKDPTKI